MPTGPCPSTSPCVVSGGDAGAADAASAYRTRRRRSLGAVTAAITPEAQACALAELEGSSCTLPRPYATAILGVQDATVAVNQVTLQPGNIFEDASMTSFEIGWAYDPPSTRYVCVFIED